MGPLHQSFSAPRPLAQNADPSRGKHLLELDGIRGLAILAVLIFHQTVMEPVNSFDRAWVQMAAHLNAGVDLFFVLSGFLITGILYDSLNSEHYYRNFYVRRFLRIVPLYYTVLLVAFVVLPLTHHPKLEKWGHIHGLGALWYWLFLSNWSLALGGIGPRHGMVDMSWSLSIEEQFYLLWPLVVRRVSRRWLMGLCVALFVTAAVVRVVMVASGAPPIWPAFMTPARMDGLAAGAWIALALRGPEQLSRLVPWARGVAIATAAAVVAMIYVPTLAGPGSSYLVTVGNSLMILGFAALLVLAVGGRPDSWLSAFLRSGVLRTFGAYSYALYLLHVPVLAVVRDWPGSPFSPARFLTWSGSPLPGQMLFYAVASIAALLLAWLSWQLLEKPCLSLKRYFPASTRGERIPAREEIPIGAVDGQMPLEQPVPL